MPAPTVVAGSTIAEVLSGNPLGALEARILLAHALQLSRVQLITQSARTLTAAEAQVAQTLFRRRAAGEPIAYITGVREFYGLALEVTPDVLIPRPETELLVELALEFAPDAGKILDLGTGSGAIAIAIAHALPAAAITALDNSAAALAVAQRNAARHGAPVHFLQSDWFESVPDDLFDLIVANPPYIALADPHLRQGDLRHEPEQALTDHADGLSALRSIVAAASRHLKPGGRLLLEHGYDQAVQVRELLRAARFEEVASWTDLAGIERVSGGAATAG